MLHQENWRYLKEKSEIKDFYGERSRPTGDSSQLSLATRVNTYITRDDDWYWELLYVVNAHHKNYALKMKKDLKKWYCKFYCDNSQ